jgi:hypothetical protein
MAAKMVEARLRALGMEPLTEYGADEAPYERWLMSEGVPLVFVYDPPANAPPGGYQVSPGGGLAWYNADYECPWVPPWVNVLGRTLRGQKLVDGIRRALRDEPTFQAVAAAYALGGQRAVEALVLRDEAA